MDRRFKLVFFRANICTVPLSLETHKNSESLLNVMLKETLSKNVKKLKNISYCDNVYNASHMAMVLVY